MPTQAMKTRPIRAGTETSNLAEPGCNVTGPGSPGSGAETRVRESSSGASTVRE